jgi:hypothetical protein
LRSLQAAGYSLKSLYLKLITVHADEQRRVDVATARRRWRDMQSLRDAQTDAIPTSLASRPISFARDVRSRRLLADVWA